MSYEAHVVMFHQLIKVVFQNMVNRIYHCKHNGSTECETFNVLYIIHMHTSHSTVFRY